MRLRYVIGILVGAAFGAGLGYLGMAQDPELSRLGIGALIGAIVGLFIVARASVGAGAEGGSAGGG